MSEERQNHVTRFRWQSLVAAAPVLLVIVALGWPYVSARVRVFKEAREVRVRIVDRLDADAAFVRAELETASLTEAERVTLRARLGEAAGQIGSIARPDLARFTTVLPLNHTHAAI